MANDHARRRVLRGTRAKEVAERRDESLWQALHEALILRLAKLADTCHQALIEPGQVVQAQRKAEALGGVATAAQQRRHPEERVVMVVGWHDCCSRTLRPSMARRRPIEGATRVEAAETQGGR